MVIGCSKRGFGMEERSDSVIRDGVGVDLFSQAMKVLTERSPNDDEVSEKDGGRGVSVLPAQLVGLLAKGNDRRKKDKYKKKLTSKQGRGMHVWIENEVYFRELKLSDIETLIELSKVLPSDCIKYLTIPVIGGGTISSSVFSSNSGTVAASAAHSGAEEMSVCGGIAATERSGDVRVFTSVSCDSAASSGRSGEDIVPCDSVTYMCRSDDEVSVGVPSVSCCFGSGSVDDMEIDDIKVMKTERINKVELATGKYVCSGTGICFSPLYSPKSSLSVEWVLASKKKILVTSERPSKKRKLLGEDAGLGKLIVSRPCEGNLNLCHICSQGDNQSEPFNTLILCTSCGVAVHKKCYGVEEDDIVESSWFCSWCKHMGNCVGGSGTNMNGDSIPCVLCPKKRGALKPLKTNEAESLGPVKFAHLFCSQWMPEVFVEDTKRMEPILNVDNIKETRKKLKCSICKVKYGACLRCSNGTCRTPFHPICAREAGNRTEIWGKAGDSNVELRAFCSKHSDIPEGTKINEGDASQATTSSEVLQDGHGVSEFGQKYGDFCDAQLENASNPSKQIGLLVDVDIQNGGVVMNLEPERCSSGHSVGAEGLKNNDTATVKPSVAFLLKRLIDQGKVDVEEIASEIGMQPDSLAVTIANRTLTAELQSKAISWLKGHAYLEKNVIVKPATCPKNKLDKEGLVLETKVSNYTLKPKGDSNQSSHDSIEKEYHYPAPSSYVMAPHTNNTVTEDANPSSPNGGTVISHYWQGRPYIHVSVCEKLMQLKSEIYFPEADSGLDDYRLKKVARLNSSAPDGLFSNHETKNSPYSNICVNTRNELEQFSEDKALGVFDIDPEDELEGELVYFQHRLLGSKLKRKHFIDELVSKAVKSLPSQVDFARDQIWDSLFVNKYLADVQKAKKRGCKEKRQKDAQAVLTAANAPAVSSSRMSTLRKADLDESDPHEDPSKACNISRAGLQSQLIPRPKEVPKVTPESQRDLFQPISESNKESVRSCDVCLRQETILNSILVCCTCKVAVHLDCYYSGKGYTEPWKCELCEDTELRCSQTVIQDSCENPVPSAECVVCGGTSGAFRKAVDGQWIHAFCAEWILRSTFRRGQPNPIEGTDSISKGNDVCCVCRLKKGVCLKCHFGNCQSTFHPSCARNVGFYMNNKAIGSKIQHKAYCEKHSSDQRAKDENQKHGTEELKSVKQFRVELERLRLLCDRIVKREKIKRELLICSHDILASKRDSVAFSVLSCGPHFHPGISSDSATTLYISGSETFQKSDDVTVDSTSSVKKSPSLAGSMEHDHKTDGNSTSHRVFLCKDSQEVPFAGKKIPNRTLSISQNISDVNANRLKFRRYK